MSNYDNFNGLLKQAKCKLKYSKIEDVYYTIVYKLNLEKKSPSKQLFRPLLRAYMDNKINN